MDDEQKRSAKAPSVKVKIAASAGGVIAGAGAAIASLTRRDRTRVSARRLGNQVGKAIAKGLGEKPKPEQAS